MRGWLWLSHIVLIMKWLLDHLILSSYRCSKAIWQFIAAFSYSPSQELQEFITAQNKMLPSSLNSRKSLSVIKISWRFGKHVCKEATSEPHGALLFITKWQHRIGIISCSSAPSLSPTRHLHLHRYAYVLFIHSARIRLGRWEASAATHFEDVRRCTATCRAKVSFACGGGGSAPLTGGGGEHAWQAVW